MHESVDASIIIINWNRLDDVLKSLHYLKQQTGLKTEVVVVDNGSTDGSAERLSRLEWIRLIRLKSNVGPAEARNFGMQHASGKYTVFLDSDAVLPKSGLVKLVARMEADPTIGILGCRIVNSQTRKTDAWIHALPESSHELREFDTYSFSAAGAIAPPKCCEQRVRSGTNSSFITKKSTFQFACFGRAIESFIPLWFASTITSQRMAG